MAARGGPCALVAVGCVGEGVSEAPNGLGATGTTTRHWENSMNRKTFDALVASAGVALAVVLLAAGGLLTWGHSFVTNQVRTQLAAQKIFFPPTAAFAAAKPGTEITPGMKPYLLKYAGQQMTTGQQAEAYANHFIAIHLTEIGGGLTYAQLSAKAMAAPKNVALAGQVATVFKGETLRGLLLNAYAFGKMGTIAGIAAIVSFAGAGVLLLLSLFGFAHVRRTSVGTVVLPSLSGPAPLHPERV
jgi:hypothetical protein